VSTIILPSIVGLFTGQRFHSDMNDCAGKSAVAEAPLAGPWEVPYPR